jgi:hypothetical protein
MNGRTTPDDPRLGFANDVFGPYGSGGVPLVGLAGSFSAGPLVVQVDDPGGE